MKKKTLGLILNAFNVILVVMIILLIVLIGKRGARPIEAAQEQTAQSGTGGTELTVSAAGAADSGAAETTEAEPEEEEAQRVLYATPHVEDSLSVRAGAGTTYDKLGSAYPGETFAVLETGESWTKVDYRGQEGFMSNSYLDFFYEVTDAEGVVTRESVSLSELSQ